jgi:hypothetical protein
VLPRPLQHVQVPARSGAGTTCFPTLQGQYPLLCLFVRATITLIEPQGASLYVSVASQTNVLPRPLQHLQVPALGDVMHTSPSAADSCSRAPAPTPAPGSACPSPSSHGDLHVLRPVSGFWVVGSYPAVLTSPHADLERWSTHTGLHNDRVAAAASQQAPASPRRLRRHGF